MTKKNKEIKCPWCGEATLAAAVKVTTTKGAQGDIVERRCPKCDKVLAAYLKQEGDFLPRIRTF